MTDSEATPACVDTPLATFLECNEELSRRIIEAAFRASGQAGLPFFGEGFEPGAVIASIVDQVRRLVPREILNGAPVLSDPITAAHAKVDEILAEWRARTIDGMLDYAREQDAADRITPAKLLAQLLMEELIDLDEKGRISGQHKLMLVEMAEHMGPDWTQGLYRAAVFATKVA